MIERDLMEHHAKIVVQSGFRVHRELGPGLLESVYLHCLLKEMRYNGIKAEQEVLLPLFYRGAKLNKDFRIDILVEGEIIIEVKAVEILLPVHAAQLLSYMKLA